MPSHTENFGNVVLESLAQQTPVVASKNSPWRQLEAERIGFWVENSPEELARVTAKILRMERTEYEGYRGRSRDFVVREFDIVTNIDKWIDLYKSLA
jgi:glycosyltransferase involved in cell wall biosynthesis